MSYQSDMITAIKAAASITNLVSTRIYSDVAHDNAVAPYIVYNIASVDGRTSHDGERDLEFPLVRFSIWAKSRVSTISICSALNILLDGNTISGSSNLSLTFSGQSSGYDTETKLFSEIIEFQGATNKN